MTGLRSLRAGAAILLVSGCAMTMGMLGAAAQDIGTEAQRESGRQLYTTYCAQCHGE
jgi:mono/diheme cytochrome c family protein